MAKNKKDFSLDIRDIGYFVDHVKDIDLRVDAIRQLGYKIGFNVWTEGCQEKSITIGKKNEIRMQITPKTSSSPLVKCAIIC